MKKLLLYIVCVMFTVFVYGQENKTVTKRLKSKYGFVVYHDGGWYSVSRDTYGKESGACDLHGKEVIPPIYDDVLLSYTGTYYEVWKDGYVGIRDLNNKELLPCKRYTSVDWYLKKDFNGYCTVRIDKKWGVLDKDNKETVPCRYDVILLENDYFKVKLNGKWGVINKQGKEIIPCGAYEYFSYYGQRMVIVAKGIEYGKDGKVTKNGKWGVFDSVAKKEAIPCKYDFVKNVEKEDGIFAFNIEGHAIPGKIFITDIEIEGGKWGYVDTTGKEVLPAQYEMVSGIKNGIATVTKNGKTTEIKINEYLLGDNVNSVDMSIPATKDLNPYVFAIVIGNEKYIDEVDVPYAENDAEIFKDYCLKTLGVSENHIKYIPNAGYNDLRKAINWLKQGLEAYGGDGSAIFYYAGHGIPDEKQRTAYLLPVDGIGSDVESGYSLEKLYQALGEMPAKSITVFLDACFSGAKRDGGMMASARGVAIKTKAQEPKGNMVVFSAAQGDETAYPYKSQQHGMFTYFLLRKLQETKGDVTLGELADYITREVKRHSFDENSRSQTPMVNVSASLSGSWSNMKLK